MQVVRHEAVGKNIKAVPGGGSLERSKAEFDDVCLSEEGLSGAGDKRQVVGKWADVIEVFEAWGFSKCHGAEFSRAKALQLQRLNLPAYRPSLANESSTCLR